MGKLAQVLAGGSLCGVLLCSLYLSLGSLDALVFLQILPQVLFLSEVQNGTMGLDLGAGFHGFEHHWM